MDKILCGNCIEIMKRFPDECIDLTVTSPPYDNLRDYQGYIFDYQIIAKELFRITKSGCVVVWIVADQTKDFCESLTSFKQVIFFVENCGFNLLDTMIFQKRNYAPAYPTMRRYAQTFEYMFVFSKGRPSTFNPIQQEKKASTFERDKYGGRRFIKKDGTYSEPKRIDNKRQTKDATNVWSYGVGRDKLGHPAPFPEQLAHDHIVSWSNEGDIVLDPMCGSGTTCKMAYLLNRQYIGIDISLEYCQIAKKRLREVKEKGELT